MTWEKSQHSLHKKFTFDNFTDAFTFMTQVAFICEKMDHHPDWRNSYNLVYITLNTHDAGNIVTEKDRLLAKKIDAIYSYTHSNTHVK